MKTILLSILLLPALLRAGDVPVDVTSEIKEVTVFLQGAQVFRYGNASLPAGRTTLKFVGLAPGLIPGSVQVAGKGAFTIMSVRYQINYFEDQRKEADVRIKELETKQESLQLERRRIVGMIAVYNEEQALLLANRSIGGTQNGVNVAQLKEAADLYRARLSEIKLKLLDLEQDVAKLDKEATKINAQLNEIRVGLNKSSGEVLVEVSAKSPVKAELALSYVVNGASWSPIYDIRVENIARPLELTYKGQVTQYTGEDWKNVALTLSTGNPTEGGTKPELTPWRLQFYEAYSYAWSVNQELARDYKPQKKAEEYEADKSTSLMSGADVGLAANITVTTLQNTTTVSFIIEEPYTVLSDNKQYTAEIKTQSIPAEYRYYAVPKLDPSAFLVARITGWEALQLLNGPANLYFEGAYVGQSQLDVTSGKDTLGISLGRDKGIVINRTKPKDFTKKQWLGANKKESRTFEIAVRNQKQQTITLVIEDQIPVTGDGQIKIEDVDLGGAELNADKGQLTWKFDLAPSASKTLKFGYSVKYPKDKTVILE